MGLCGIFAWSYKGIYVFRGERHGPTINAALCRESVLYIYQGRGFRRKKKCFSFVIYGENIFLFRAFFFNVTHGFHNDQENVEIISFFLFFFFWIDKSIQWYK